jgi:hypothetical protein
VLLLGAERMENNFPSIVASIRVYRAAAWQRVDQIVTVLIQKNHNYNLKFWHILFKRNLRESSFTKDKYE